MSSVKGFSTPRHDDGTEDESWPSEFSQTVNTPMFDLTSPCGKLSHIVLRPSGTTEQSLQITCGYRDSGLIRIFSTSKNKILDEITHHKGGSISGEPHL